MAEDDMVADDHSGESCSDECSGIQELLEDFSDELDSISGLDVLSLHAVSIAVHAMAKANRYVRIMSPIGNRRLHKRGFLR